MCYCFCYFPDLSFILTFLLTQCTFSALLLLKKLNLKFSIFSLLLLSLKLLYLLFSQEQIALNYGKHPEESLFYSVMLYFEFGVCFRLICCLTVLEIECRIDRVLIDVILCLLLLLPERIVFHQMSSLSVWYIVENTSKLWGKGGLSSEKETKQVQAL